MLVRIVKMTFNPTDLDDFIQFFSPFKEKIRATKGCNYLQILRDKHNPNIIFSYSYWDSEEDLNNYRYSELFKEIWPKTKSLFAEKAEAWTNTILHELK